MGFFGKRRFFCGKGLNTTVHFILYMKFDAKFAILALLVCGAVLLSGCPQAGQAGSGLTNTAGAPNQCTDSDGGKNYFVKGTTSGADPTQPAYLIRSFTDKCPTGGKITEYYCNGIWVNSVTLDCPTGYGCNNDGACVPKAPAGCNDTDKGRKPLAAGTCTDGSACGAGCKDACAGTSAVQEYFCDQGKCFTGPYGCDTECKNAGYVSGKCSVNAKGEGYCECAAAPKCSDSDVTPEYQDGINPFTGGVCRSAKNEDYGDICNNATNDYQVMEYSCREDGGCTGSGMPCDLWCANFHKGAYGTCTTNQFGYGYCECSGEEPGGVIDLYDLKGYPYDPNETISDWKVRMHTGGGSTKTLLLMDLNIVNSKNAKWSNSSYSFGPLRAHDSAIFLQGKDSGTLGYGYAKVTFDGVTGDYAYITLTGPRGEKKQYQSRFNPNEGYPAPVYDFEIVAKNKDLSGLYYNQSEGEEIIVVRADVQYADMQKGAAGGYVLLMPNEDDFKYGVILHGDYPGTTMPFFGSLHKVLKWGLSNNGLTYYLQLEK